MRRVPLPASMSLSPCSSFSFWSLLTDVLVVTSLLLLKKSSVLSEYLYAVPWYRVLGQYAYAFLCIFFVTSLK